MTMLAGYATKKLLKEAVGEKLMYTETSPHGQEYKSTGTFTVCNRPSITGFGREWFAEVTLEADIIKKVT